MDENLIAKKELLELTGISYGSLYRWKRKKLIPDEWFIRRSTFTGHETFFPRDRILQRIAKILELKEDMSLDDVAETLNPAGREMRFTVGDIERAGVASRAVVDLYLARYGTRPHYDFDAIFSVYMFRYLLTDAPLGREEAYQALELYAANAASMPMPRLICLRKLGVFLAVLSSETCEIAFDPDASVILDVSAQRLISNLKEILGGNLGNDHE